MKIVTLQKTKQNKKTHNKIEPHNSTDALTHNQNFQSMFDLFPFCLQAIHGYRETEKLKWNADNQKILQRVRELAFPPGVPQIAYVHVLDISKEGYIKPHVDAVRVRAYLHTVYACLSVCLFLSLGHLKKQKK